MPKQETFLHEAANGVEVEVLKTYDESYAQEVFRGMSPKALEALAATLSLADNYEASDIPAPDAAEYEDFLWDEICEEAIEDVRLVAIEDKRGQRKPGAWKGKIEVGPEFFLPLPPEEIEGWE